MILTIALLAIVWVVLVTGVVAFSAWMVEEFNGWMEFPIMVFALAGVIATSVVIFAAGINATQEKPPVQLEAPR